MVFITCNNGIKNYTVLLKDYRNMLISYTQNLQYKKDYNHYYKGTCYHIYFNVRLGGYVCFNSTCTTYMPSSGFSAEYDNECGFDCLNHQDIFGYYPKLHCDYATFKTSEYVIAECKKIIDGLCFR